MKELVQIIYADICYQDATVRYLNTGNTTCWNEDNFEQIPISEKILIDMGFEKRDSSSYRYKIDDSNKIRIRYNKRLFGQYIKISYLFNDCGGVKEVHFDNGRIDINRLLNVLIEHLDNDECCQLYETFIDKIKQYIDNKYKEE